MYTALVVNKCQRYKVMSYIMWFFKRSAEGKGKALKDLESIFLPLPQWDAAAEQDVSKLTAVSVSTLKLASEAADRLDCAFWSDLHESSRADNCGLACASDFVTMTPFDGSAACSSGCSL